MVSEDDGRRALYLLGGWWVGPAPIDLQGTRPCFLFVGARAGCGAFGGGGILVSCFMLASLSIEVK